MNLYDPAYGKIEHLIIAARSLSAGRGEHSEYVRGQADLICDAGKLSHEIHRDRIALLIVSEQVFCRTCGSYASISGRCACWALLSDALENYLAMDYDQAADEAGKRWDALTDAQRAFVHSGTWASEHGATVYDPSES